MKNKLIITTLVALAFSSLVGCTNGTSSANNSKADDITSNTSASSTNPISSENSISTSILNPSSSSSGSSSKPSSASSGSTSSPSSSNGGTSRPSSSSSSVEEGNLATLATALGKLNPSNITLTAEGSTQEYGPKNFKVRMDLKGKTCIQADKKSWVKESMTQTISITEADIQQMYAEEGEGVPYDQYKESVFVVSEYIFEKSYEDYTFDSNTGTYSLTYDYLEAYKAHMKDDDASAMEYHKPVLAIYYESISGENHVEYRLTNENYTGEGMSVITCGDISDLLPVMISSVSSFTYDETRKEYFIDGAAFDDPDDPSESSGGIYVKLNGTDVDYFELVEGDDVEYANVKVKPLNNGSTVVTLPTVNVPAHVCADNSYFTKNEEFHYHACGFCGKILDYEEHSFNETTGCCDTCGLEKLVEEWMELPIECCHHVKVVKNAITGDIRDLYLINMNSEWDNIYDATRYYCANEKCGLVVMVTTENVRDTSNRCLNHDVKTYSFYKPLDRAITPLGIQITVTSDYYVHDFKIKDCYVENGRGGGTIECQNCGKTVSKGLDWSFEYYDEADCRAFAYGSCDDGSYAYTYKYIDHVYDANDYCIFCKCHNHTRSLGIEGVGDLIKAHYDDNDVFDRLVYADGFVWSTYYDETAYVLHDYYTYGNLKADEYDSERVIDGQKWSIRNYDVYVSEVLKGHYEYKQYEL